VQDTGRKKNRLSIALGCCICIAACGSPTAVRINQGPATVAYMVQSNPPNGIVGFSTVPNNNGSQVSTLTLPPSYYAMMVATDSGGQIYVATYDANNDTRIFVYAPNSNGAATPLRSFNTTINVNNITEIAVDPAGELYAVTQEGTSTPTLFVYSSTATGNATPIRSLQLSGITIVRQVNFDSAGSIYVAGYGPNDDRIIAVYKPLVNGIVTPMRTITFDGNAMVSGVAVDSAGNIFVNVCPECTGTNFVIEKFAPGANGTASPTNTIELSLGSSTHAITGGQVYVDGVGNVFTSVVPISYPGANITYVLYGFSPNASGSAQPSFQLANSPNNVNGLGFAIN
jgi:hypothetical protein